MAGSPTVRIEIDAFTEGRRGRLRPWKWLVVPTLVGAAILLMVPTVLGAAPWAPILHWGCERAMLEDERSIFVPEVLGNSPFGGWAWANSSTSGGHWAGSDGAAGGSLLLLNVELYRMHNVTLGGPGSNHRCNARYAAIPLAPSPAALGSTQPFETLPGGSRTDAAEPGAPLPAPASYEAATFHNGLQAPNLPPISTCGRGSASLTVSSVRITVDATFQVQGHAVEVAVVLLFSEHFHYVFPADFGVWSLQNLAAGFGAPGGGYAFSYAGCATSPAAGRK